MEQAQVLLARATQYAETYTCQANMAEMSADWVTPFSAVAVYLFCVLVGPTVFGKGLPKAVMKPLFCFWNLLLSAFSVFGFWACFRYIWADFHHTTAGLEASEAAPFYVHRLVCSDDVIFKESGACYGYAGFAAMLFVWSKFWELGDTAFLILMGKKIEFLQWYHHATVLVYCWFAFSTKTPSALTFGTMNYFVHSVMYFYFAVCQYSTILRPIRSVVTLLQLAQMVIGVSISVLSYIYANDEATVCSVTYDSDYFMYSFVMYFSYLLLFLKLFLDSYVFKTRKVAKVDAAKKKQ